MAAACSYWPARSSSNPWPIACAGSARAARTSMARPRNPLLGRIHSPEILEHHPPLLGRQPLQLLPGRIPQARAGAGRAGTQDIGEVHAVSRGGAADALLFFVGLVVRQRAPGV